MNSSQLKNNKIFPKIKGNFGFGIMRFKQHDGAYNETEIAQMIDAFFAAGFNYIDTAHVYHEGKSEEFVRKFVAQRHNREEFVLTNKLSGACFRHEEDINPLFEKQLTACGVNYFDFYLMHSMGRKSYKKYKRTKAFEQALALRDAGKIKHFGISFHDTAEVLEQILNDWPEIEVVQIQLNYLDMDDAAVQSRAVLDVCNKYNKPVIVMEPVKGGSLIQLPENAIEVLGKLKASDGLPLTESQIAADLALRFAATQPGVFMTLSGMNDMSQVKQNAEVFSELKPLNKHEKAALAKLTDILNSLGQIRCTACNYCLRGCPRHIDIPSIFACYNRKIIMKNWNQDYYYRTVYTSKGRRASDCEKCGKCEAVCPQHLPIRQNLEKCAEIFDRDLSLHK